MRHILTLLALLVACGPTAIDCPPGAFLNDWQAISDSKTEVLLTCKRQFTVHLADHGSVGLSSTDPQSDLGTLTLSADVQSDCVDPTIWMAVSTTDGPVLPVNGRYSLSAQVTDTWLVALGILADTACTAVVDRVEIQLTP